MFEVNHANKKIICYIAKVLNKKNKNLVQQVLMNADLQLYNGIRNRQRIAQRI